MKPDLQLLKRKVKRIAWMERTTKRMAFEKLAVVALALLEANVFHHDLTSMECQVHEHLKHLAQYFSSNRIRIVEQTPASVAAFVSPRRSQSISTIKPHWSLRPTEFSDVANRMLHVV
ncbi:hypothetical protein AC1031_013188 [Aphanomyces cochlioides]|nr:hypothetical protein AC1031_013188 [Aphanomyces cochlioides]